MPFTVSHAAAVLPLKNSPLPLAALMIGSMSPDFAYFLPGELAQFPSHELEGLLLFSWPVSLFLWLLFVHALERPTIELLPAEWRARVPRSDPRLSLKALAVASIAVMLGAITHVAWDAFTHGGTPVARAFPIFNAEIFSIHGHSFRLYRILQYLCSILGLLALGMWARNLRRLPPRGSEHGQAPSLLSDRTRLGAALLVVAASAITALLSYANYPDSPFQHRIFQFLIGAMTGGTLAWAGIALLIGQLQRSTTNGARSN